MLDAYVFASLSEMLRLTEEWLRDYNDQRPHESLGRVPPTTFIPRPLNPPESSNAVST